MQSLKDQQKFIDDVEEWKRWLNVCRHHIQTRTGSLEVKDWWDKVYSRWLKHSQHPDYVIHLRGNPSISELLFVLLCHMRVCNNPTIITPDISSSLGDLTANMRILLCRHTPERQAYQNRPSEIELMSLLDRVSGYIVNNQPGKIGSHPSDEDLKQAVSKLHMKSEKKVERSPEEQKRFEEQQQAIEESGSLNHLGRLWSEDTVNLCRFTALANRFFYQYLFDIKLLSEYPVLPEGSFQYPICAPSNFHKWLKNRSAYNMNDDNFIKRYRQFTYEMMTPMGAFDIPKQHLKTRDDVVPPINAIEDELGADTTERLMEIAKTPIDVVMNTPDHIAFNALVLATVNKTLFLEYRVKFYPDYYIPASEIRTDDSLLYIRTVKEDFMKPRPPLILYLADRFYIHSGQMTPTPGNPGVGWIPCRDVVDAILRWCVLVRTHFQGELVSGWARVPVEQKFLSKMIGPAESNLKKKN